MSDLSPEARALIDQARDEDRPEVGEADRVRAMLTARLAREAFGGARGIDADNTVHLQDRAAVHAALYGNGRAHADLNPHTSPMVTASAQPLTVGFESLRAVVPLSRKVMIASFLVLGLASGAFALELASRERAAPSPRQEVAPAIAPAAPAADEAPGEAVEPAPAVAAEEGASTLERELRVLRRANAALEAGRADDALRALARHAREFPQAALSSERESLRVLTLCALGRRGEAVAAARRLIDGGSFMYSARLASSCAGEAIKGEEER